MPPEPIRRPPAGTPVDPARAAAGAGGRASLVTPVRLGGAIVGGLVTLAIAWGLLGGVGREPAAAAAIASPPATSSVVPAALAAVTPSPATPAPTGTEPATASPDVTATPAPTTDPSPVATPAPTARPAPGSVDRATAAVLQKRLEAVRARLGIPGVSVAILWDDGRSWTGASGRTDAAGRRPMTTGTAFALASISKTFTAAVVLQLVDEGKLGLDQRVAPLLPAYHLDRRITVRELLDHTSGLPDFFFGAGIDAALQRDPAAAWTPKRTWGFVRKHRPAPGHAWSYSNTNYLLLGELVKAVTGHSIANEIRDRLLDPLGLGDAWYQGVEQPRAPETAGFRLFQTSGGVKAVPVAPRSDVMPFRSVVTAAGGAGSIAATALDTARWMQAFAGGRLLSPTVQAEMIGDMARTRALDARIPYGLGIQGVPVAGRPALGHSGRYLGFRNVVRYLPADGITIAVLTNQGGYDPTKFATALLKVVLPAR